MNRVRPTRAVAGPLVGALVMYLLVKVVGGAWLSLASTALLVLPVVALLLPARLDRLVVVRRADERVHAGQDLVVSLTIRNDGRRTTAPLCLHDVSDGLAPVSIAVPALRGGSEATVSVPRAAIRRGVFEAGTAVLVSSAPLGLMQVERKVDVSGRLVVHPVVEQVRREAGGATRLAGEIPLPLPGVGTEVLGLRDWRSGDSARAVSARASARHGRPLVLERERDSGSALVLLAGGPGRGPAWEVAVSRGASLALAALVEGTPPVLLGAAPPARMDRAGVLDWFAGVDRVSGLSPLAVGAALKAAAGGTLVMLVPSELSLDRGGLRRACAGGRTRLVMLDA